MIFGHDLLNLFIPAPLQNGGMAAASLQQVVLDVAVYYTQILSAIAAFIAFIYIILAGYTMFTAFGDESKYATGKKTLMYAVIGFAISMLANFIVQFFIRLLGYGG